MKRRICGLVLAFALTFTAILPSENIYAEQSKEEATSESMEDVECEMSVKGTNSFGELLADTLLQEVEEQQENNGCNIFSIEMDGTAANVSFETVEDCTLVVNIYDEDGVRMLASGSTEIYAGKTEAVIDIDIEDMPQYFYLRGFLVESETLRPLAVSYESPMYTQEMQEFLSKTTEDFETDRILNLDDDKTNNFAVFSDDIILISQSEGENEVITADDENSIYVFENADEHITSLRSGDVFAYEYGENGILIIKVKKIEIDGTTVTITGAETSMNEVFEYVKIDEMAGLADAEIDPSTCDEDVNYEGLVEYVDEDIQTYAWEGENKESIAASYKFADKKFGSDSANVKFSGSLELKLEASIKYYISWNYQYLELKIDYSGKVNATLSGKIELASIKLAYIGISPVPGVYIEFTPSFVVEASAKFEGSGKLTGTIGFSVSGDEGIKNLTTSPSLKFEVKGEVSVFLGLSLKPEIKIIHDKIAKAGLDVTVGGEVKGTIEIYKTPSSSKKHECRQCIDGDISGKAELKFEVSLLNWDKLTFTYKKDFTVKLFDFYYSFDFGEFAFTTCPHLSYKVTVAVKNGNGNPISGAKVNNNYTTGNDGKISFYLTNGNHMVSVSADGYKSGDKKITVQDDQKSIVVILEKELDNGSVIQQISLSEYSSGAVTKNGSLYMWGNNSDGQLGNGTRDNSNIPIRVLENVESVSLGECHSGAVTKDGSLYMWGDNSDGQLGDGTRGDEDDNKPIKVLENVESVSLGGYHSGAITRDGSLYMWGLNFYGQLGDGTRNDSSKPVKVLENVESVSLGGYHSGAVTKDGNLYMWGDNEFGELGDGTRDNSNEPIKVLENVKSISLGEFHSGAVTKDGSLYMWGWNSKGELGDGTKEHSDEPIKVLENVESVSLGKNHSGAVTKDGSLHMWGGNHLGELGDGTRDDSNDPIKILGNVESVSLGTCHSGAVTKDGSLYVWGVNIVGQLGDGTITDSIVPKKITIPFITTLSDEINVETELISDKIDVDKGKVIANAIVAIEAIEIAETKERLSIDNPSISEAVVKPSLKTASFTGLSTNEVYNFYVLKSRDGDNLLSSDNMLYIQQAVSDDSGNLSFSYEMREDYENPEVFLVSSVRTNIAMAEVTVPNLVYNGKGQFISPVVKYNGVILTEGIDYELEGDYSATNVGTYVVTVVGIGAYQGKVETKYQVVAKNNQSSGDMDASTVKDKWNTGNSSGSVIKKPSVSKVKSFKAKAGKKKLTLSWKKLSGIDGYQIQISTKKNYKGAKIISISKSKKKYTKKGLKAGKKYFVRIRACKAYKDANGKTQMAYGNWVKTSKKTK